jgi:hypothetical protein
MVRFLYFLSNSPRQYFHKRGAENVRFEASRIVPGGGFSLANTEKAEQSSIRKSDTTRRDELIVLMREPAKVDLSASAGCKQIWRRCSGCGPAKKPKCSRNMVRIIAPIHITSSLLRGEQRRQNAWHVKYWEIIVENLRNAGWNCGSMATTDGKGRPIWVVAAERSDAGRFIVHADQELPAFLELESAIRACGELV